MRVAVVGGGIAGLAAGYRLQRSGAAPVIFEKGAGDRTGSQRVEGFIIDKGAYTIPEGHSAFLSLVRELGLSRELRETPGTASTFVNGIEHRIKIDKHLSEVPGPDHSDPDPGPAQGGG